MDVWYACCALVIRGATGIEYERGCVPVVFFSHALIFNCCLHFLSCTFVINKLYLIS